MVVGPFLLKDEGMAADLITGFPFQLASAAPLLLVWSVGIILAVTRRHEAPATFRLVLIALVLLLLTGVVGVVVNTVLPFLVLRGEVGVGRSGLVLGAVGVVRTLVDAAWVLLLVALFPRRGRGGPNAVAGPGRPNSDTF